ncbi:MAG: histidine kinase [Bacteroidota bacterium]|jgi:signal transduction histidine kinase
MDNRITKITVSPVQISGESSKPHITRRGVAIVIGIWCIYTLLTAIPPLQSFQVPFLTALFWQTIQSAFKFILSVPVWFIVIRWMHKKQWYWKGLAHLFLGPIYALLNYAYQYYMAVWFGTRVYAEPLQINPGWLLFFNLFIYIMQFILYHGYEILRKLRIKEKITLELLTLQKEQELAILKSQINPHFFFNTLNTISARASKDAEETRTMIAQLADMFRYVMEGSKNDLVPLQKELKFVKDYVDLESKRMGDRLAIEFQVDQSLATFPLPPMILQPLIENAIKHGITPLEEGGKVTVQIQKNEDVVVFRVSDTGVGLSSTDPLSTMSGIGLKNTDARLRRIYGDSARLKISSLKNSGCEVTFILPSK